jgi:hypothetical protein
LFLKLAISDFKIFECQKSIRQEVEVKINENLSLTIPLPGELLYHRTIAPLVLRLLFFRIYAISLLKIWNIGLITMLIQYQLI